MENTIFMIISGSATLIAIISIILSIRIYTKYEKLLNKLGEGKDFSKMLSNYISQVNDLNKRDDQIIEFCNNINKELSQCIRKIGICRYNAFGNTKNELSFAIALLDRENNGIIINSIYGQDNSNVYSKSVIKGKTKYKISEEEEEALNKAING